MLEGWRLYLDECVEKNVVRGLQSMGIDVESAHTLNRRSDDDLSQLVFAAREERTLLTYDTDFLAESALFLGTGQHHSGILLTPASTDIGRLLRSVRFSLEQWKPEDLRDQVRWLLRVP